MKILNIAGRYVMNVLLSIDQVGNSLCAGDPDETISSRLGRIKIKWSGTIPWTRPVCKVTEWWLNKIQPGHCVKAIEHDEGERGLIDKPVTMKQHYEGLDGH